MKPRDLHQGNWDVNVAVFELPGFDARVTADGKRMWFRVSIHRCYADVTIPIKDFRKAVNFVGMFDMTTLTDKNPCAGLKLCSYYVEIIDRVGTIKKGKLIYAKTPAVVHIAPLRQYSNHSITIRLSEFRKIIRWYNSDI